MPRLCSCKNRTNTAHPQRLLCTGPWGKNEFHSPSLPSLSWECKTEQQPSFYPTSSASYSSNTAQCSGGPGPSPTALETPKEKGRAHKGQPGHWDTLYPQLVHGVRVGVRGGGGVCMHQFCVHRRSKEGQKNPLPKSHTEQLASRGQGGDSSIGSH